MLTRRHHQEHVILDEAQQVPSFFPVLRGVVDRCRSVRGRFVLLGAASPNLIGSISDSLTGAYLGDGDDSLGGGVMALSAPLLLKDPRSIAKL